jgi:acyl-coenzyme A thioesterase PaaI-like protein
MECPIQRRVRHPRIWRGLWYRKARASTEPLRAIGTVLHCGKQLATAEGRIVDTQGKLYAHATTTCLVFELKK